MQDSSSSDAVSMTLSHFQVAPLVASPSYPNSVAWSEENLLAIATGHLVTILNPAELNGSRGVIPVTPSPPFNIGRIERQDLTKGCLLPISMARDVKCYVRSITWSSLGMAPNGGCLLAVCTSDGHVKIYRAPYSELRSEWVEVCDISDRLCQYYMDIRFGESDSGNILEGACSDSSAVVQKSPNLAEINKYGTRRKKKKIISDIDDSGKALSCCSAETSEVKLQTTSTLMQFLNIEEGASVEVLKENNGLRFWVLGTINRLDGSRALVRYTGVSKDEVQQEWISLQQLGIEVKRELTNCEDSSLGQSNYLQKIRPCIGDNTLPKDLSNISVPEGSEVPRKGQLLEVCVRDRWVEGTFAGFRGSEILLDFEGAYGKINIAPSNKVRLAPIWNEQERAWNVIVVTVTVVSRSASENNFLHNNGSKVIEDKQPEVEHNFDGKRQSTQPVNNICSVISAEQYAFRSGLLASVVVAWSPTLKQSLEGNNDSQEEVFCKFSVLAVGAKAGKVSLWRISEPSCYTIDYGANLPEVQFIGTVQAHNSWVTAASWIICSLKSLDSADANSSSESLVLATGSSDGSVRLWQASPAEIDKHSSSQSSPLTLLREVVSADSMAVSSLALATTSRSPSRFLLAIGKGSGLITVWVYSMSGRTRHMAGHYDAHDQVVTGLAWAYDSRCLYSCGQDNSIRSWFMHGNKLVSVPFPSSSSGLPLESSRINVDIPSHVFDCCYGLAVSPGSLIVAAVRSVDADMVDQMYQSRSQKAAVELFWIAGQQLKTSLGRLTDPTSEVYGNISKKDIVFWETNVLWSLTYVEDATRPLVLWDILRALSSVKFLSIRLFEAILSRWLLSWFPGSSQIQPLESCLNQLPALLSNATCRKLHLIVTVCRYMFTSTLNVPPGASAPNVTDLEETERGESLKCWASLLQQTETELRQRLLYFTLSAVLRRVASTQPKRKPNKEIWIPAGVPQMQMWIQMNANEVSEDLNILAEQVGELGDSRVASVTEFVSSENCMFCKAAVDFESPELAYCQRGTAFGNEKHKLHRCAISMQVASTTAPMWFCVSCKRWALKQLPDKFLCVSSLQDVKNSPENSIFCRRSRALCPFCGILMQRFLPDFLLRTSPV